ncbi:MAG: sodium:alanine symporter family protein [Rickettsiales bacterium]|nr:sodium:alanine symporter family protein [Pseudomonadota bacterium]MDA0965472.1 sodium:alanine symporter family protein [Pseudomonadota bacterium]MDG4542796.1 sodium:alanine symporter family protein [Rickettsiales bacterium]MDG4544756.1 sodium:alanine symporter family protein [Rickettsiales bacterium]MDG4546878.1 sodium:alanine symporter family protein [Rickettsiales bacterium]
MYRILSLVLLSLVIFSGTAFDVRAEEQVQENVMQIVEQPVEADAIKEKRPEESLALIRISKSALETVVGGMATVLFYKIAGFPVLVLWLVAGGLFFTLRLGFVNITMFRHAIDVVRGKYSSDNDPGEVTHLQALTAAVSATVGLGNIAGVAVAVTVGGPGAVIWMMIAGFFGMSAKFAEVTLGLKYRKIDENGKVSGGAFHYLTEGLAEKNLPMLGKILAVIFAIFCIGGSLGGGNMFQSNQTVSIMTDSFETFGNLDWAISLVLAVSVGFVLIGGIKRIAQVAEKIVPVMALIYMTASIIVIIVNSDKIGSAVSFMLQDALSGIAVGGGILGVIINGFKRAAFSNEAGLGSAPIAHSAAKTKEPVRAGVVALLEPFIDTMVICFVTGLVITITGVYKDGDAGNGVLLTSAAFSTVIDWFPKVLAVAVALFAFSTMITWSYYGERAWGYLFGYKYLSVYHIIFCFVVFLGGVLDNISLVVDFSDLLLLSMAIPNIIGLYILSGMVKKELADYTKKLKEGKFKIYK